jgi:hypothetical protein
LTSLGIQSLDLNANASGAGNNGNVIGLESTYQTQDGATHAMADVWLMTADDNLRNNVSNLAAALSAYQSDMAVAQDAVAKQTPQLVTGTVASSPMSAPVAGLVSSLQQFNANGQPITSAVSQLANGTSLVKNTTNQLLDKTKDGGLLGGNGSG